MDRSFNQFSLKQHIEKHIHYNLYLLIWMIICLVDDIIIIKYDELLSDKRFYLNYFVCKPTYLLHAYYLCYYTMQLLL